MPSAPLRYCSTVGCSHKVSAQQPCPEHPRSNVGGWQSQGKAQRTIAGRKLQRLRMALFAQEPFCRTCKENIATIRDHVIPLAEGGTDEESNVAPICADCHEKKTRSEAIRGRARAR